MVRVKDNWVGVNTSRTNDLVQEAIENKIIDDFGTIDVIRREVKVSESSRLDFLLQGEGRSVYIEVKNCSLAEGTAAMFPDAVTIRGTRHLLELARLIEDGFEAGLIICVSREDAEFFTPAAHIDPVYTETIRQVQQAGVKILAYQAEVNPGSVTIVGKIPTLITDELYSHA